FALPQLGRRRRNSRVVIGIFHFCQHLPALHAVALFHVDALQPSAQLRAHANLFGDRFDSPRRRDQRASHGSRVGPGGRDSVTAAPQHIRRRQSNHGARSDKNSSGSLHGLAPFPFKSKTHSTLPASPEAPSRRTMLPSPL